MGQADTNCCRRTGADAAADHRVPTHYVDQEGIKRRSHHDNGSGDRSPRFCGCPLPFARPALVSLSVSGPHPPQGSHSSFPPALLRIAVRQAAYRSPASRATFDGQTAALSTICPPLSRNAADAQRTTGRATPADMIGAAVRVARISVGTSRTIPKGDKPWSAAAELGRLGGAASARKLTTEQNAEIGRKGAEKRWAVLSG